MKYCLTLTLGLTLAFAACETPNRTDNLAPVVQDEDQYPGNENEPEDNKLTSDDPVAVGSIQSYAGEDAEESYSNIFRRDEADADFTVVTDDEGMPYTWEDTPSNTATPDPDGDYVVRDRVREQLEYGSNRASEITEAPTDRELRGGNQDAIGAVGYANHELAEYYDTDEEDYGYNQDSEASGNSWYRPLNPAEKNYNEQVVRVGGAKTTDDYRMRYEELQDVMYSIPENQQARLYAPNTYSYDFVTSWSGLTKAARTTTNDPTQQETAYDTPPLMGTGCEQADDPITCSTTKLDGELKEFLNDPRVLRDMRALGVEGITFDVDEQGKVKTGSVRATAGGKDCTGGDCTRFNRSIEKALQRGSWSPAMYRGTPTVSRVRLPLRYQQTEEMQDLG